MSKLETEKIIPDDKDGVVQTTQDPQIIDNSNSTVKISAPPNPSSSVTVSQNLQKSAMFWKASLFSLKAKKSTYLYEKKRWIPQNSP